MMHILFSCIGRYHGFNKNNPTSDSGGKTKIVQRLKDKYGFKRYCILLFKTLVSVVQKVNSAIERIVIFSTKFLNTKVQFFKLTSCFMSWEFYNPGIIRSMPFCGS